jgi:formate hydrogenlyase transcriptional activator
MAQEPIFKNIEQKVRYLEKKTFELQQKLDEYRESETRYRVLFEEAGDGIFILENEKIVDCNQKVLTLFGCPRDQLIGKTPFDFSPETQPNGKNSKFEAIKRLAASRAGKHQYFEWKHLRFNGTLFDAEVSLKRIKLPRATYVQAIMRDVTIRKEAVRELEQMKNRLQEENIYLQEEIRIEHNFGEIIGRSQALKKVLSSVEKVAATKSSVLIMGETGTGKELIARAIHSISERRDRPLVKINCAALPANLIESELFGHEKGAFTGAMSRRVGRFELAHGGTIFLDEIGELPLELQSKLLRVLQDGEFERVGGAETFKVDVRIIAATNRDLEKSIGAGLFREDLFYRLNVFPIFLPPLRDRKEDIPILATHFVMKYAPKDGKKIEAIPQKTMSALQDYCWPGNVRELENVIERGIIISQGSRLKLEDWLPKKAAVRTELELATMEEVEKAHIIKTLKTTEGRVSGEKGAAGILGLNPQTLYSRMKRLGITRKTGYL